MSNVPEPMEDEKKKMSNVPEPMEDAAATMMSKDDRRKERERTNRRRNRKAFRENSPEEHRKNLDIRNQNNIPRKDLPEEKLMEARKRDLESKDGKPRPSRQDMPEEVRNDKRAKTNGYLRRRVEAKRIQKMDDSLEVSVHKSAMKCVLSLAFQEFNEGTPQFTARPINPGLITEKAEYLCRRVGQKSKFDLKAGEVAELSNGQIYYLKNEEQKSLKEVMKKQHRVSCFVAFSNPVQRPRVVGCLLASSGIILQRILLPKGEAVDDGINYHFKVTPYKVGFIDLLGVEPGRARKKGHGKRLVMAAIEDFQKSGTDILFLFSTEKGKSFFDRMGFKSVVDVGLKVQPPHDLSMNRKMESCFMMMQFCNIIHFENIKNYYLILDREAMKSEHWKYIPHHTIHI